MKKLIIKYFLLVIFLTCFLAVGLNRTNAQQLNVEEKRQKVLSETGKQVVFDASVLTTEYENFGEYHWDFGDGGSSEGLGVLHTYLKPGYYEVSLTMAKDDVSVNHKVDVYIYNDLMLGVLDSTVDRQSLQKTENNLFENGKLWWIIDNEGQSKTVEEMVDVLLNNKDIFLKAKTLVVWGHGSFGLDFMVALAQRTDLDFGGINIVSVSSQRFGNLRKTADTAYKLVNPKSLILVNEKAIEYLDSFTDIDNFMGRLTDEGLNYELIGIKDRYRIESAASWMLLTKLIDYSLFKGIPLNTIYLILMIPLVALLIALARQVVGIKAFGIYVPSLITLAFLESGLRYGTLIFVIVLLVGTLARIFLGKLRILYLPRMAIILTLVALGLLMTMALSAYFDLRGIKSLSIVPLMTMVILAEKFVSAQIRYGFGPSLKLTVETFILSAVCYLLVGWQTLKVLIVSYPELILLTIPLMLLLGRWTGLRLVEYWRFRRILK